MLVLGEKHIEALTMMDQLEDDHQSKLERVHEEFQAKKQLQQQHLEKIAKEQKEAMEAQFAVATKAHEEVMLDNSFEPVMVPSNVEMPILPSHVSEPALPTYAHLTSTESSSMDTTEVLDHIMAILESDAMIKQMIPGDDQESFLDLMRSQLNIGIQKWSE